MTPGSESATYTIHNYSEVLPETLVVVVVVGVGGYITQVALKSPPPSMQWMECAVSGAQVPTARPTHLSSPPTGLAVRFLRREIVEKQLTSVPHQLAPSQFPIRTPTDISQKYQTKSKVVPILPQPKIPNSWKSAQTLAQSS